MSDGRANPPGRPALLVSVRDAREAERALAAHADWIDAKNPDNGSLGAVDANTLAEIIHACTTAGPTPVSAALGELVDNPPIPQLPGLNLVKVGLAHTGRNLDAVRSMLERWLDGATTSHDTTTTRPGIILAAYADHHAVDAPSPAAVLDIALSLKHKNVRGVLIDTAIKNGRSLLDHMPPDELRGIIERCRLNNLIIALAGSLTFDAVAEVVAMQPDIIAVRSAACAGFNRSGSIDANAVARLRRVIRAGDESLAEANYDADRGRDASSV